MASLSSLLRKTNLDDHEALLQAANDALQESRDDRNAQQVKAIALLKLERYPETLRHFKEHADLQSSSPEAYAYCLYKSGQYEEALRVAQPIHSRGAQHLALQAAYRAEDYQAAEQAYQDLARAQDSEEAFDLSVNLLALKAEGLWLGHLSAAQAPRATTEDFANFETAYNSACVSIAKGSLQEADLLLRKAVNLCEHHEGLEAEEKDVELLPIKAQRLFVLQNLGKNDDAESLAKEVDVLLSKVEVDPASKKLAQANTIPSSKTTNPFLIHKRFESVPIPKDERLFSNQLSALLANERTTQLQTFKHDGLIGALQAQAGTASPQALINSSFAAIALAQNDVGRAAVNKVLPEFERRPDDVGLMLTVVQLYVLTGNTAAATNLMRAFFARLETSQAEEDQDVRNSPGLVGLLISLYRNQGRRSEIKKELARVATYWRSKPKASASLLRSAGIELLDSSNSEDAQLATSIFDRLYEQDSKDQNTVAGYVASHARDDPIQATKMADQLASIDKLVSTVDVTGLENAGIPQSANALVLAQAGNNRKRALATGTTKRTKRIRKSRLPKDYDSSKNPDPERWLPLRDRTSYKPKKKKARKDDRTQGGGNVNESLDISKKIDVAASEVLKDSTGNKNKKKGKGKR